MNFYTKILSIWLFILLNSSITFLEAQQESVSDFVANDLDNYINKALEVWNLPGASVAIVKDGKVIVSKGYGILHHEKKDSVDENTLFMIASNTKAFTAHALALLEYKGDCNLNDKVVHWVPEFKMNDPWVTKQVSINDVLSHRLGLKTYQGDFMYFYSNLTKEEIYEKFHKIIPNNGFREKYGYCNAGYFWAGECIESITGDDWNLFIKKEFLKPLQMNRTKVLSFNISEEKNVAAAHTFQHGVLTTFPHTNIDRIGPAASISSSAKDLSHWLIAQTDSGRFLGKQIIPYEVIKNTRFPRIPKSGSGNMFFSSTYSLYGLGWNIHDYQGVEVISHGGGILGFSTAVTLVPELNLGIAVLTNSDENRVGNALKWEIIDSFLDLPFRNYNLIYRDRYLKNQNKKNQSIKILQDSIKLKLAPSIPLNKFEGIYTNPIYGNIEIRKAEDSLDLILQHHPNIKANLVHVNNNRFLCSYFPSRMGTEIFPFEIENNEVKSFSLKVADRHEYTRYDFVKK